MLRSNAPFQPLGIALLMILVTVSACADAGPDADEEATDSQSSLLRRRPHSCRPNTCTSLGLTCGTAGDGCGGLLQCGSCPTPPPQPAPTTTTPPPPPPPSALPSPVAGWALGKRPFAPSSSWNTKVPAGASYARLQWPAPTGYNYGVAWDSYSPAIQAGASTDPVVHVSVPAGWGWPAQTVDLRLPQGVTGATGTDGEILMIDGTTIHNCWQFKRTSTTTASCSAYGRTDVVTGSGWGTKSPFLGAGIVATGSSQLAGLLVQAETDAGEIEHALQITLDFPLQKPGAVGEAISSDGGSQTGIAQEGDRLAIPSTMAMPAGLSPLGQKVFRCMQNYGVFDIDVSGGTSNLRAQANAYGEAVIIALQADVKKLIPALQHVQF